MNGLLIIIITANYRGSVPCDYWNAWPQYLGCNHGDHYSNNDSYQSAWYNGCSEDQCQRCLSGEPCNDGWYSNLSPHCTLVHIL